MGQTSSRLTLHNPASYRISIQGHLPNVWRDRIGGMMISTERGSGQHPVTVLTGQLMDQAALFGVLSTIYMLGLPLLSVECTSFEGAPTRG
jgi:hypothetical protein